MATQRWTDEMLDKLVEVVRDMAKQAEKDRERAEKDRERAEKDWERAEKDREESQKYREESQKYREEWKKEREQYREEMKELNIRFISYQQSSAQLVSLAFAVIAGSAAIAIIAPALKALAELYAQ